MIKNRILKTPRQKMEIHLDNLYRELIRKRAMRLVHGCQFCLRHKWSHLGLQAAHCFGRGHHTVRWDPRNGAGVCPDCHDYLDTHRVVKLLFFRKLLGNEEYEKLAELAAKTTKDVPIDYVKIEKELKEALKEV